LSDFGRTLQPSGSGSDHGWGSHHLILGAFIPTTSIDQYGATLAAWLGVPVAQLQAVFPNIANFSAPTVGFMGP
jgi:uncharacterized protein (DUF1501 family)